MAGSRRHALHLDDANQYLRQKAQRFTVSRRQASAHYPIASLIRVQHQTMISQNSHRISTV
jgi:hypothetical protein